jgi:hypothetical protein
VVAGRPIGGAESVVLRGFPVLWPLGRVPAGAGGVPAEALDPEVAEPVVAGDGPSAVDWSTPVAEPIADRSVV